MAGLFTLAAVTVTLFNPVIEAGAVYSPVLLMPPIPAGLIDHLTPAAPALDAVAVSCRDCAG